MVHIYHGNGKGKTTCSYGLALRAKGCGKDVRIIKFLKPNDSGEARLITSLGVPVHTFEKDHGFIKDVSQTLKNELHKALDFAKETSCEVLVLDEVLDAILLDNTLEEKLFQLIKVKPETEIIITGRHPSAKLMDLADYITEFKKIKHPYDKGVLAREGIEF